MIFRAVSKLFSPDNAVRLWFVGALAALAAFVFWSVLVASVLGHCYGMPDGATRTDNASSAVSRSHDEEGGRLWDSIAGFLSEDRSGASAVCVAALLLACARFCYLRWRLALQQQLLADKKRRDWIVPAIREDDAVLRFLDSPKQEPHIQLLERRLAGAYDLHGYVGTCVTLGLFGTLVGLWVGFVQTLGPTATITGAGADLQTALSSSVIVVATAALSSIMGIGIGRFIIEPMAEQIDHKVEALIVGLLEDNLSKKRSRR